MATSELSLLGFSDERSALERQIEAVARELVADGSTKSAVVHALAQVLIDLCLEEDQVSVSEKIGIMRHTGRSLLAIVEEIEDRIGAIERSRIVGLPDNSRN
jgi:hypothetical protein